MIARGRDWLDWALAHAVGLSILIIPFLYWPGDGDPLHRVVTLKTHAANVVVLATAVLLLIRVRRHGAQVAGPRHLWWILAVVAGLFVAAASSTASSSASGSVCRWITDRKS